MQASHLRILLHIINPRRWEGAKARREIQKRSQKMEREWKTRPDEKYLPILAPATEAVNLVARTTHW